MQVSNYEYNVMHFLNYCVLTEYNVLLLFIDLC